MKLMELLTVFNYHKVGEHSVSRDSQGISRDSEMSFELLHMKT